MQPINTCRAPPSPAHTSTRVGSSCHISPAKGLQWCRQNWILLPMDPAWVVPACGRHMRSQTGCSCSGDAIAEPANNSWCWAQAISCSHRCLVLSHRASLALQGSGTAQDTAEQQLLGLPLPEHPSALPGAALFSHLSLAKLQKPAQLWRGTGNTPPQQNRKKEDISYKVKNILKAVF